jgi:diguanylate cyclase (GGDEF)-like protein/PAS domain S-box-containing protein
MSGEGRMEKSGGDGETVFSLSGHLYSPGIFETLPCPIVALDLEGRVTLWNKATEIATGWRAGEVLDTDFPAISPRYQENFRRAIANVAAGNSLFQEELRGIHKNGSLIKIQFSSSPIRNAENEVTGILVTFVNQSQREKNIENELSKGNIFIERVLDNLPVGLAVNTIDKGNIGYANRKFLEIYGGWSDANFTDLESFFAHVYPNPDERETVRQMILSDIATGDPEKMRWDDMRITMRDGSDKIIAVRNIPVQEMNLMISTVQDVTEQKFTEQALRESERRYQVMAEASPVGIFRLDEDGRCCHVNKRWREIAGLTQSQVLGKSWDVAVHPDDKSMVSDTWKIAVMEGRAFKAECRFKRPGGRTSWVFTQAEPIFDAQGLLEGFIGSVTDISRRKRTEEEIRQLAYYDPLTRLPNRSFFMEQLERALASAQRTGRQVALLFCDLDNFKDVNDSLGHDKGDILLQIIAGRLSSCTRRGDTLSRFGGDEFVLLLPSVTASSQIVAVARKIQRAMSKPFDLDGHEVYTTTSIGIAVHPSDGGDVQALLKHADMAMYVAKGRGRNRYQFFSEEMNNRAQERLSMEAGLRQAIARDELNLVWQPQYCLETDTLLGAEALLRWNHPELGQIRPDQFIPLAEETGLIHSIGAWVLRQACRQARLWKDTGAEGLRFAVNLSASQFMEPSLVSMVKDILSEEDLDASWLELEITESILMRDAEIAMKTLGLLQQFGINLAIDDFGTGYSSLLYLKKYPISRIKIAKEFVTDITRDKTDAAIAGTVITMAKNLEMRVIAEGVETEGQAEILRQLGCHEVQGYLYSRPISASEFGALLDG